MWMIVLALAAADIERIEVHGRAAQHDAVVLDVASGYRSGETMSDILRHAPGLQVRQTGGPGGALSLSMQGSGSSQVLVLLDGVPLTSTTLGTPLLQFLDPAEVASVEVVSGAAAAAYGSGAMSGVVHIRTRADGNNVIAASQLQGTATRAVGTRICVCHNNWGVVSSLSALLCVMNAMLCSGAVRRWLRRHLSG